MLSDGAVFTNSCSSLTSYAISRSLSAMEIYYFTELTHKLDRIKLPVSSGQRRTAPPTEPGFSQGFFLHSVTDGVLVLCRCRLLLAYFGTLHFQRYHQLDCTETIRTELSWTMPSLNSIMKCL